jgi:hypothetical protein
MAASPRQAALSSLKFARKVSNDLISTVPADKLAYQPAPTDNHVLWNLGHLAMTYNWGTGLIGGDPGKLPESYAKLFGGKATPTSDPKAYPPLAELRKHFDDQFNIYIAATEKASDAKLAESLAEKTGGFASDGLDLINKMVWHEGWHAGQVSSIRRALKLPPVIG